MLEDLTIDDFRPLLNQGFRIAPDDGPAFEVELVEVTEIPREPGGRAPFSLVFRGGPDPPLHERRVGGRATAVAVAQRVQSRAL